MKKGIYLGANKARHLDHNIIYQDIEKDKYKCDLGGSNVYAVLEKWIKEIERG